MKKGTAALRTEELSPAKRRLLELMLEKDRSRKVAEARSTLPRHPRDAPPPASLGQERLWFLQRFVPETCAYNIPAAVRLLGPLDEALLEEALRRVVERHETLRTRFAMVRGRLVQVVDPPGPVAIPRLAPGEVPPEDREALIQERARAQNTTPYDLEAGPLLRCLLLCLGRDDHALLVNMHHTVTDGLSVGILVQETAAAYAALVAGREPELPRLAVQYADYAAWQRDTMTPEVVEERLGYWREALAGAPTVLELPTDRPRPPVQGSDGARHFFRVPAPLEARLGVLATRERTTPFVTYVAALAALLQRYSGQDEFLVGTPISGRPRPELEPLIGFFIDTVVLRADLSGRPSFVDLLARLREVTAGALGHQEIGFENLVEAFQQERDLSRHPLFQVVFSLQPAPMQPMTSGALEMAPFDVDSGTARFDLEVVLWDLDSGLAGLLEYNTELFDRATVVRFERGYQALLRAVAERPDEPLDELPLVSAAEAEQILGAGRGRRPGALPGAPAGVPIHRLVARRAAERGDAPAIVAGTERWTYRELEARSNRLARLLAARGVGPEEIVAVLLPRSPELVMSELAVLKAGGAFAPFDPTIPEGRLRALLEDCGARVAITDGALAERLGEAGDRVLRLDRVDLEQGDDRPPEVATALEQRAYVIYTSGSTGRPKGVEIEHRALLNLVSWYVRAFELTPGDRGALVASPAFDASVTDVWPFLAVGAALHVPGEEVRASPERLRGWLVEEEVSVLLLTTLVAESLLRLPWPEGRGPRCLLTGGEKLETYPPEGLPLSLFNLYGPTENAVVATAGPVPPRPAGERGGAVPSPALGRPLDGVECRVLDRRQRLVPDGVPGELCLGGASLARSYLGRPALTAERFVPAPFVEPGGRLYRTGDLVRRRLDGSLEFLGRNDHQVKIRGFRIELGEIEAALRKHPQVREAAVEVRGNDRDGDRRLLAYVVPAGALDVGTLRRDLGAELPSYMVPALFVPLDELPLTPAGKLDRRSLPVPEEERIERERAAFVAPRTETERVLAEVFAEVLRVAAVGVDDDFFHLGGQSLLATQAMSRIREALGAELPLRVFFESPTVAALAAALDGPETARGAPPPPLPALRPVGRGRPLPLSFAQERLWFLDRLVPGLFAYNVPGLVRMAGSFDLGLLRRTLTELVRRHEVLRTTYALSETGRPVQVIGPPAGVAVPVVDLAALAAGDRDAAALVLADRLARRPFDLARDPILRATVLRFAPDDHRLVIVIHHIGFDMWSRELLIQELGALYRAFAEGRPSPLPEPEVQYADFACWQRGWMEGELLDRLLGYWRRELEGAELALHLPADRPRTTAQTFRGRRKLRVLPRPVGDRAREVARSSSATPFVTFLAAVAAFLGRYTGQDDLVIGAPIANRHRKEIEGLVGFFVNTLVLRARMADDPPFRDLVGRMRDVFAGAFAHQDLPVERLAQEVRTERDRHHQPLFQVSFNFIEGYVPKPLRIGDLTMSIDRRVYNGGVVTDLSLAVFEVDGAFNAVLDYSVDLFDDATAERILRHLAALASQAVESPGTPLSALGLLDRAQRHQVLAEWNDTRSAYPAGETVASLFHGVAAERPEAVAVACGDVQVTYGELERRAGRLAGELRRRGVGPEAPVAIALGRSPELVVGLLGIVEAGGFYLPIDAALPEDRLRLLLDDLGARLVLTSRALAARFAEAGAETLELDAELPTAPAGSAPPPAPWDPGTRPENLVYVCYTSGSTGRPKGVGIDHRAVARLVREDPIIDFSPRQVFLMLAVLSFDASTLEIWGSLLNGARLAIYPRERVSLQELGDALERHRVTTLWLTAGLFHVMMDERPGALAGVEQLLAGGDVLSVSHVRARLAASPGALLVNGYGPTEGTTFTACQRLASGDRLGGSVPIGRPIASTRAHVADRRLRPVPVGVEGELVIGGDGLARGYLGRPGATAARFVPDPSSGLPGARLYRSGDRVRALPDGRLDFVGRDDFQVKVRGFRIELGEIETVLGEHPAVRKAVVLAPRLDGGERRLAAYVEAGEPETGAEELRAHLAARLPAYMVPEHIVLVEAVPLTANGKIDRAALAALDGGPKDLRAAYVAPRTGLERELCELCAELLGVERVGVEDHFFRHGGHSLLATQLFARIEARYEVQLSLPEFFETPTVAEVARSIEVARWARGEALAAGAGAGAGDEDREVLEL